jgi:hypothetical protein
MLSIRSLMAAARIAYIMRDPVALSVAVLDRLFRRCARNRSN